MSNIKDSLGDRMKKYESVSKTRLMARTPVIIRIDGCHFHTFTKGFVKPFDEVMMQSMKDTTKYLCEHISGCVLGYTQSDEITLVLCDYQTLNTQGWFDYEVEKLCSVTASMATMAFNKSFAYYMVNWYSNNCRADYYDDDFCKQYDRYIKANGNAYFDARCFNLPIEEVTNCLLWRQNDAKRNSVQGLAQSLFPHKEIQGLNCDQLKDKMLVDKQVNWDELSTDKKHGSCVIKDAKGKWTIDNDIPRFSGEGREYIESRIKFE